MSDDDQHTRAQVERWRDELLDLTGRNRLLRFRHTKSSSLEIDDPGAQDVLDKLLSGRSREWRFFLPEDEPDTPEDADPTVTRIGLGTAGADGSTAASVQAALQRL